MGRVLVGRGHRQRHELHGMFSTLKGSQNPESPLCIYYVHRQATRVSPMSPALNQTTFAHKSSVSKGK